MRMSARISATVLVLAVAVGGVVGGPDAFAVNRSRAAAPSTQDVPMQDAVVYLKSHADRPGPDRRPPGPARPDRAGTAGPRHPGAAADPGPAGPAPRRPAGVRGGAAVDRQRRRRPGDIQGAERTRPAARGRLGRPRRAGRGPGPRRRVRHDRRTGRAEHRDGQRAGPVGQGVRGQGVVIASMDTGVDATHPDLSATWRGGGNSWFDPNGQHATPTDVSGHGTQTMGVMVGRSVGGSAIGMAPDARWIAVKIFNDRGVTTTTMIHRGFQWLLDPDGEPGDRRRTGRRQQLVEPVHRRVRAGLPARPAIAARRGDPAGLRRREHRAVGRHGAQPGEQPGGAGRRRDRQRRLLYPYSGRGPSPCTGTTSPAWSPRAPRSAPPTCTPATCRTPGRRWPHPRSAAPRPCC